MPHLRYAPPPLHVPFDAAQGKRGEGGGWVLGLFLCSLLHCASAQQIQSAITVNDTMILASEDKLFRYGEAPPELPAEWQKIALPNVKIQAIRSLSSGFAVISHESGIYLFTKLGDTKPRHLGIDEETKNPNRPEQLPDYRIRRIYEFRDELYITYYTPQGVGVTICSIIVDQALVCKTWNTLNSPLKSNFVHQVVADMRGFLWFRYSDKEDAGVSRFNPTDKQWSHFNQYNSELGDSTVTIVLPEIGAEGLPGDNVWFVTKAGLSRLQYAEKGETWKLYGDKSASTPVARLIGIETWFTDAIIHIQALSLTENGILIANKNAVYIFNGENINRFAVETAGGLDENRIEDIYYKNNIIVVLLFSAKTGRAELRSLMVFDMVKRQWRAVPFWSLSRKFPSDIYFAPLKNSNDLVILNYRDRDSVCAIFDASELTLKPIEIVPLEKTP